MRFEGGFYRREACYVAERGAVSTGSLAMGKTRRLRIGLGLLMAGMLVGFLGRAEAGAQKPSWNFPADWELWLGKYAGDKIRGSDLFAVPQLAALLRRHVDAKARGDLENLSVESPIERRGDWIVVVGCRPHMCGGDRYVLAIDGATRELALCMKDDDYDARTTTLRWFGRKPATVKFPLDAGAGCPDADDMPALLAGAAVDVNGHPLGESAPGAQKPTSAAAPAEYPPGGQEPDRRRPAAQQADDLKTIGDHTVEVVRKESRVYKVVVDGKILIDDEGFVSLHGPYVGGGRTYVLVEKSSGGTACPSLYQAIDL
jgi:hypothetical protein